MLPISTGISDMACQLVEAHALSRSLHMADALIAATAITYSLPLLKGDNKHFAAVAGLGVDVFKG